MVIKVAKRLTRNNNGAFPELFRTKSFVLQGVEYTLNIFHKHVELYREGRKLRSLTFELNVKDATVSLLKSYESGKQYVVSTCVVICNECHIYYEGGGEYAVHCPFEPSKLFSGPPGTIFAQASSPTLYYLTSPLTGFKQILSGNLQVIDFVATVSPTVDSCWIVAKAKECLPVFSVEKIITTDQGESSMRLVEINSSMPMIDIKENGVFLADFSFTTKLLCFVGSGKLLALKFHMPDTVFSNFVCLQEANVSSACPIEASRSGLLDILIIDTFGVPRLWIGGNLWIACTLNYDLGIPKPTTSKFKRRGDFVDSMQTRKRINVTSHEGMEQVPITTLGNVHIQTIFSYSSKRFHISLSNNDILQCTVSLLPVDPLANKVLKVISTFLPDYMYAEFLQIYVMLIRTRRTVAMETEWECLQKLIGLCYGDAPRTYSCEDVADPLLRRLRAQCNLNLWNEMKYSWVNVESMSKFRPFRGLIFYSLHLLFQELTLCTLTLPQSNILLSLLESIAQQNNANQYYNLYKCYSSQTVEPLTCTYNTRFHIPATLVTPPDIAHWIKCMLRGLVPPPYIMEPSKVRHEFELSEQETMGGGNPFPITAMAIKLIRAIPQPQIFVSTLLDHSFTLQAIDTLSVGLRAIVKETLHLCREKCFEHLPPEGYILIGFLSAYTTELY
jgi:hypothetical protein